MRYGSWGSASRRWRCSQRSRRSGWRRRSATAARARVGRRAGDADRARPGRPGLELDATCARDRGCRGTSPCHLHARPSVGLRCGRGVDPVAVGLGAPRGSRQSRRRPAAETRRAGQAPSLCRDVGPGGGSNHSFEGQRSHERGISVVDSVHECLRRPGSMRTSERARDTGRGAYVECQRSTAAAAVGVVGLALEPRRRRRACHHGRATAARVDADVAAGSASTVSLRCTTTRSTIGQRPARPARRSSSR